MVNTAVGFRIREQRKRLGLTQVAMAQSLAISPAYLNLIEANKRSVGGKLLKKMAELLDLDVETLSGAAEQRMTDDLRQLPADAVFRQFSVDSNFAEKMVAQNPEWARMMLVLYRAYLDQGRALSLMNDRLNRDPQLQTSVHRMMTHITSIRSVSEILHTTADIDDNQRYRFYDMLHSESARLTGDAQKLVSAFDIQESINPAGAVMEQVDEFIITHRNYFPQLEVCAENLIVEVQAINRRDTEGALVDFLYKKLGIDVRHNLPMEADVGQYRNQVWFDDENRRLHFLRNCPRTTRRFQMLRIAAEQLFERELQHLVENDRLTSHFARQQTKRALASYIAAAVMMPYAAFLQDAEAERYDVDVLTQKYDVGYEQVCHRLVSLRKPGATGLPFAFMRVDPAGFVSKRFPLARLPLPRYGHVCPIWSVFSAFQSPGRVVRDLVEFPQGERFLMLARTVLKRPAAFHEHSVMYAVMLACDVIHADRTVYSEGLDLVSDSSSLKVGPNCSQCSRIDCQQRQETAQGQSQLY